MMMFCQPGFPYGAILRAFKSVRLPEPFGRRGVYCYLRGSTALWNGLKLSRLKPGEIVLFPSYHCGIELDVLLKAGFQIQFYCVSSTLHIDLDDLRRSIRPTTKALYVIHYFGFPHALDALKSLCAEYDLVLIEDCAQALYGRFQGEPLGTFGDLALYSMRKTLPLPCGGALVVNDTSLPCPPTASDRALDEVWGSTKGIMKQNLAQHPLLDWMVRGLMKRLIFSTVRTFYHKSAKAKSPQSSYAPLEFLVDLENNVAMSSLSMWLFKRIPHAQVIERRRKHFQSLLEVLKLCKRVAPLILHLPDGVCPCYCPVIVPGDASVFLAFCRARGVWTQPYWEEVHPQFPIEQFPEALWLKKQIVVLPVHQDLSEKDMLLLEQIIIEWEQGGN